MAKWTEAKKQDTGMGDILRINLSKDVTPGNPITIRILGKYVARYVRWVTLTDGNKRTVECLGFNRDKEIWDNDDNDPLKGAVNEKGEEIDPQFAYAVQCIDRSDGKVKLVELKKTVFNELVAYAQRNDYGDFTDEDNGYDITIEKEKTGPLPINVKYKVVPARNNTPLTKEERDLPRYDLDKLYPRPTVEEQRAWLIENTNYLDDIADENTSSITEGADEDIPDDIPF